MSLLRSDRDLSDNSFSEVMQNLLSSGSDVQKLTLKETISQFLLTQKPLTFYSNSFELRTEYL